MKNKTVWFQQRTQPIWERRILPLKDEIHRYLELGVGEGFSLCWMARNMDLKRATGVDSWTSKDRERAKVLREYRQHAYEILHSHVMPFGPVAVEEFRTMTYLSWACQRLESDFDRLDPFDMIYVDADHRGVCCLRDVVMSEPLLAVGGRMVIDDLHRGFAKGRPEVWLVQWCMRMLYKGTMKVEWEEGRQVCFRKLEHVE